MTVQDLYVHSPSFKTTSQKFKLMAIHRTVQYGTFEVFDAPKTEAAAKRHITTILL